MNGSSVYLTKQEKEIIVNAVRNSYLQISDDMYVLDPKIHYEKVVSMLNQRNSMTHILRKLGVSFK